MKLEKVDGSKLDFKELTDTIWKGTKIADVFPIDGTREMACGVHEIVGPSETMIESVPVQDVIYILEGELTIETAEVTHTYKAGDFCYLPKGVPQKFIVPDRVKHIYVCYPADWTQAE